MPGITQRKSAPEHARCELALGRCLVEGDPETASRARRGRRKSFGVSLAIEIFLLAVLVVAPLLTSVAQPQLHQIPPPQLTFLGAWRAHNRNQRNAPTTATRYPTIPNPYSQIAHPVEIVGIRHAEESGEFPSPEMPGAYVPGAIEVDETVRQSLMVEPPRIAQPAQQERHPLILSEVIQQAQLIARIEPEYPRLAVQTKTEGTVRLHAVISRDGRIAALEVLSGHPFPVRAALDAVRQWRYRPTLLNGEPVEVETSITVIFRLRE